MKQIISLSLFLTWALVSVAHGGDLPPKVASDLQVRDQKLSQLTFNWSVITTQIRPGLSAKQIADADKIIANNARATARKGGVTDAKAIDAIANSSVQRLMPFLKGYRTDFSTTLRFVRNADATLVEGRAKYSPAPPVQVQGYYGRGFAVMAVSETGVKNYPASVWGSTGDSTHTFDKPDNDLALSPETFVMQMGINPLAVYDAHWKLLATSPQDWILESQVNHNDKVTDAVVFKLSRQYDGIPVEVQIKGDHWTAVYRATKFVRQFGTWVCTQAQYVEERPGIFTRKQLWSLDSVVPSKRVSISSLNVAPHTSINDYRLGDGIGYHWNGTLPSLTKLKKLQDIQHPGESTVDPSRSGSNPSASSNHDLASNTAASAMPFAGGVLLLTGGVWMFKQRKAN